MKLRTTITLLLLVASLAACRSGMRSPRLTVDPELLALSKEEAYQRILWENWWRSFMHKERR